MRRQPKKTGDYGIGLMIHSVHMTDDVPRLNQFYEDVFGGLIYMGVDEPNWLPLEDRWAGLIMISDLCIETMAPNPPADPPAAGGEVLPQVRPPPALGRIPGRRPGRPRQTT